MLLGWKIRDVVGLDEPNGSAKMLAPTQRSVDDEQTSVAVATTCSLRNCLFRRPHPFLKSQRKRVGRCRRNGHSLVQPKACVDVNGGRRGGKEASAHLYRPQLR
jgi:hypothetical protein